MYAIYRELNPPTGVEHCIECNFFSNKQRSLVVAATSVLRVYNLRKKVCEYEEGTEREREGERERDGDGGREGERERERERER